MAAEPRAESFGRAPDVVAQRQLRFSKRLAVQRCRRIVERCLQLTPAEVAHRLRRMVTRNTRTDGSASAPRGVTPMASLEPGGLLLTPEECRRTVRAIANDATLRARVVGEASRVAAEGVRIFDCVVPLDSPTLDWKVDPVTGRAFWRDTRMTEGDAVAAAHAPDGKVGADVKFVWELNRHQFLLPLAVAARAEGDGRMLRYAATLVDRWIAENPAGVGVNWSSVLEVGMRAISWLWALPFLADGDAIDELQRERWLTSIVQHYDFLRSNLSVYTDRSNHLIGEATALWLLASLMPGLADAPTEAARALDVLATEIERQVTPDGVSCEQAIGYHCFVLDFYLQIVAVARRRGDHVPPIIESRLAAMLSFLDRLLGPGGAVPNIGDADDGSGLPIAAALSMRERAEAQVVLGARLLDRAASGTGAVGVHPLTWLAPKATPPGSSERRTHGQSIWLRDGGYCFLEADRPEGGHQQLIFDVGRLGYLPNAAHEHADALSVLVKVNATLVLGDPGTGTYTGSSTIRNGFRGTASHNTVTVDDLDQADVLDTFKWVNATGTRVLAWNTDAACDYVDALHTGYRRLREPVVHRRAVLFARPDYWVVVDRLTGRGTHRIRRRFHVPPEIRLSRLDSETYEAVSDETGDGVRIVLVDPPGHAPLVTAIETAPWSAGYGRWGESMRLSSETCASPDVVLLTLIVPVVSRQCVCDVARTPRAPGRSADETALCRVRTRRRSAEDVLLMRSAGAENDLVLIRETERGHIERRLAPPDAQLP